MLLRVWKIPHKTAKYYAKLFLSRLSLKLLLTLMGLDMNLCPILGPCLGKLMHQQLQVCRYLMIQASVLLVPNVTHNKVKIYIKPVLTLEPQVCNPMAYLLQNRAQVHMKLCLLVMYLILILVNLRLPVVLN